MSSLALSAVRKNAINCALVPVALFSRVVPRRRELWCFGGYNSLRYADHSRMLFEEVSAHRPDISAFWSTRSAVVYDYLQRRGLPVVKADSFSGLFHTLRAGVCVYTHYALDHNRVAALSAFRVQLWHGIPLKQFKADSNLEQPGFGRLSPGLFRRMRQTQLALFQWLDPKWHLLIFQSELDRQRTGSAFRGTYNEGVVVGSIRAEWLYRAANSQNTARSSEKSLKILYAPTHRKQGRASLFEQVPVPARQVFEPLLAEFNARIEVRMHPFQAHESLPDGFSAERVSVGETDEVEDIYHALKRCDVVLTDYSSILVDALAIGIPVVGLAPDRDEYAAQDQGFYADLGEFPGPMVDTWKEALEACRDVTSSYEGQWSQAYARAKVFYYGSADNQANGVMARVLGKIESRA